MKYLIFLLIILPVLSYGKANLPIKIAIFDNTQIASVESNPTATLESAYLKGVNTAVTLSKKENIDIDTKTYFYGNNLLNILQKIPLIKQWKPDVVLGLHSSNEAIMAKNYFTKPLVLSITATDTKLFNPSKNFYSLGVPDSYIDKRVIQFIKKHFPHKNIFIMVGVENKESVDTADYIANLYKKAFPHQSITKSEYLTNDIISLTPNRLLQGYHKGDLILFFSIAGTYSEQLKLMNKIGMYLKPYKPTFITTVDNWQSHKIMKAKKKIPYNAYRVSNLYSNPNSKQYRTFLKEYVHIYNKKPKYQISYISYKALMSIVNAIKY